MTQHPVSFKVEGEVVRGYLHTPTASTGSGLGVLMLHGWSGSKLGPHRMFVKAARMLCDDGHTCLRFDFRGRGDSDGTTTDATIATMVQDARDGVTHLLRQPGIKYIVALGICSGGKVAVMLAASDSRVNDLALWSAEALGPLRDGDAGRRKTIHALRQYARKALRPETWKKLITGRTNVGLVRKAVVGHEMPDSSECVEEGRALSRFKDFTGSILSIYGGNDPETRSSATGYQAFCRAQNIPLEHYEIAEANHSFYSLQWEGEVIARSRTWLKERT